MLEYGIHHIKTKPYHSETDGNLEHFHRILKDMLKSMVANYFENWDEFFPWICFTYRKVPVQGLGFLYLIQWLVVMSMDSVFD